ncbi:MAG: ABC transporter, permease protein [candidate division TA06 bacterium 34_109]|uniref:ABC transporter, permease protein n=1 Tax=candidate division TA06 bacterium 34_109 TaxID=1635277 RepID=A0A101HZA3_UNCT6|nr:MAG: ABC transporter, permease protein [candidate division TA06 bacterium 34_109]
MIPKQNQFLLSLPMHIFIILVALIWIFPTAGLLITSFRPASAVASSGWWTVFANPFDFTQFTLSNYKDVITNIGIGRAFVNTLIITIPACIIPIIIASFAAYAFAWMEFWGRHFFFILFVGLLVVPLQMTLIPILRIFNMLGLSGSFLGIWLAHAGYGLPLVIYLMYNFVSGLPSEIFESATIDGATPFQIFKSIVLPLSVPALASITIFQFIWVWNDLLVALVYLGGTPDVAPLTVRISALVGSYGQNWELLTAAAFVSMLLPLIIFLSLQRYFVRGILAGSIKG